jgi:hypothetical protein
MRHEDKPDFAGLMVSIGEYYGREISDGLMDMYWHGLQHYDLAAVRDALNRHVSNPDSGQFMPKIADITKMLGGTTQDSALRAWAKVDQAVRRVGTYRDVAFDDPLIHRVLHDMGGWVAMGQKTEDEWPFVAKEFENRYRGFRARSETPEYPPVLNGIAGMHNRQQGHQIEPPMLIGNPTLAQQVMKLGSEKPMIGFTQAGAVGADLRLVSDQRDEGAA